MKLLMRDLTNSCSNLSHFFPDLPVEALGDDLEDAFDKTSKRIKEASLTLLGTLKFIESHRAVLKAKRVTRLTELAFLSIPFSFLTSLFSMLIKEYADLASVSKFLAFAIPLSAFIYLLRLNAQNSWIQYWRTSVNAAAREANDTACGTSIPDAAYLVWATVEAGSTVVFIVVLCTILIAPLAVLWTRPALSTSVKIPTTIFSMIMVGAVLATALPSGRPFSRAPKEEFTSRSAGTTEVETEEDQNRHSERENTQPKIPFRMRIAKWIAPDYDREHPSSP